MKPMKPLTGSFWCLVSRKTKVVAAGSRQRQLDFVSGPESPSVSRSAADLVVSNPNGCRSRPTAELESCKTGSRRGRAPSTRSRTMPQSHAVNVGVDVGQEQLVVAVDGEA